MARKHRRDVLPGDPEFIPLTDAERRAHAQALLQRAEHDPDHRAQALSEAAEYYAMLGEHEQAEHLFGAALAAGGPVAGSAHGFYASYLFDQHRDSEALDLINQARKLRPVDPEVFTVIGESLLDHGHPEHATRWFTTGLVRYLGELATIELDDLRYDPDATILARGRYAARHTLGLPHDHIDDLVERVRAEAVRA